MSQQLINDFYQAFQRGDAHGMTACYHEDIVFSDPAFGVLKGDKAKAMWHMLLANKSANLQVSYDSVTATETSGSAHWEAKYQFGPQQRKVINNVTAKFTFADGLITSHHDTFDLWRWSRQALGVPGLLLGWSSFMSNKIKSTTNTRLCHWMKAQPSTSAQ